jgi:outer membrane protein OmpA-like peptidoglycan-associated protein
MNIKTNAIIRGFLVFLMMSIAFTSFSQAIKENKAKKYYAKYDYYNAIDKYEDLTDKSLDIKLKLANSYFNTAQYEKAEEYFEQVVAEKKDPDVIYDYVKVLLINEKYKEAEKQMAEFKRLVPDDSRAVLFASNKGFYNEISKDRNFFAVKKLDFNTDEQEFAPAFFKDKVVFSATKKGFELFKRHWAWNHMPYLDLYIADYDSSSLELKNIEDFKFNKKYHEGTVTFNYEGDMMIMTANNYKQKSAENAILLGMYISRFQDGKWTKLEPMPFNNQDYSVGHPSLTNDGKTLYFASDMPGGHGGVDLYRAELKEDGTWSEPVNLGSEINTEANEMFPFIHPENYLFFASNGRPGLGGLDIFVASLNEGEIGEIENLKAPMNSNFDDFAFILTDDMKRGYFSSNRVSGLGSDDIYGFELVTPFFASKRIVGTAVDKKTGKPLAGTEVKLTDADANVLAVITTEPDGKYDFELEDDQLVHLSGQKELYSKDKRSIDPENYKERIIKTKLELEKLPVFNLHFLVLDAESKEPISDAKAKVVNKDDADKGYEFVTDDKGEYFMEVKGKELNTVLNYALNISKDKYVTSSKDLKIVLDKEGQIDVIEELAKIEVGIDLGVALNLKPIYFDFNKSNIRPDAAIELDKIVKAMNENPSMKIELGSHTDSRGSARYNASLSRRRANSSVEYIRERIENPKRIYGKGYGESTPLKITEAIHKKHPSFEEDAVLNNTYINRLKTEELQEEAHQLNRRTEFKIIEF